MYKTKLKWKGELAFDAHQDGKILLLDAKKQEDGYSQGFTPMRLLLSSLAGCSSMDVVSLLKKMRVSEYELEIAVEGFTAEEHPMVYQEISLSFNFTGDDIPTDKVKKAVAMTTEKYCPVYAMLDKSVDIKTIIYINKVEIN